MKDAANSDIIDLSGEWQLRNIESGEQFAMPVPCDGITALYEAGVIPDPYWGRNEYDLRWISQQDWKLSRQVKLPRTDVELVLSGLDCVAEVRVNDVVVLNAQNAFRTHRVDISRFAITGDNRIDIVFRSPVAAGKELYDKAAFPLPWSKNCPIPYGNMLRKPACDFGWDWNIALAPFGLYGVARIEPIRTSRITSTRVTQGRQGGHMTVQVDYKISGDAVELAVSLDGQLQIITVNDGTAKAKFTIENPELWWPAGQGDQPLYQLTTTLGQVSEVRNIGLRTIELVNEGGGFTFRVNGRDVYAKGANWIPADALPGRITAEATRDLLQSAVDANMNMIRIWGGGRYEPDWFYDICDELGLMVWQDFMFACNLYPSDPDYLEAVAAEVRENVLRLNHHPSIALWCGDNELIGALTWYPESVENRDTYLVNYDRLNRTIETALKGSLPDANWWPSSPSPGPLSFGDAWHDDSKGDMHFWSVWHEAREFEHYRDVTPRFCSEFGFQSFPSMDVVRQFAGESDLNISSPVMDSHQKNVGGNARITETMFRYFRFPVGFENFVYLSQVQQGFAIKTAVDAWSSRKPQNMGALYWQLNDTWPVASWASLDYGGGWKLLHHMARRFFQPLRVVAVPEARVIRLFAINDGAEPVDVSAEVFALSMDGNLRSFGQAQATASTDKSVPIFEARVRDDEMLYWRWNGGEDHFAPHPYKSYDLQAASVSIEHNANALTLTTDRPTFFASVEADQPVRFSDNAMLLLPGTPKTISYTTSAQTSPTFTLRHLHAATH